VARYQLSSTLVQYSTDEAQVLGVVRAVVSLVGHHMLILVRYEKEKLIFTYCHVITSHKLDTCAVQNSRHIWHIKKSPHNTFQQPEPS